MTNLEKKTAFVTGASRGIGRTTAQALAAAEAYVIRRPDGEIYITPECYPEIKPIIQRTPKKCSESDHGQLIQPLQIASGASGNLGPGNPYR